ncbi:MAG: alkaline phosphatase family protein [Peptostreptococcaceae bacterium]
MLNNTVLIVLDGLCYDVAKSQMGYLNHLVEKNIGSLNKVKSELPSMSRPLYETILTGVVPHKSGITNNKICRLSNYESIFHRVKNAGGTSCAAAYHWISELYNKSPFDYLYDCYQEDLDKPIQYGRFYFEDTYPDSHLFIDAEVLRNKHNPDFLYIHPMGIDDIGHKFGNNSKEYRSKAIEIDVILSNIIPMWLEKGYEIIVTSDHGMNEDGNHGGIGENERMVPLFYFGKNIVDLPKGEVIEQTQMASIVCKILGIEKSEDMSKCKY